MEEGEIGGACGTHAYMILVRKSAGNSLLGRHKHMCEDNIKMDFRETEWERVDCIHLVQDREKSVVSPGAQCSIIPFCQTWPLDQDLPLGEYEDPSNHGSEPPCHVEYGETVELLHSQKQPCSVS